MDIDDKIKQFLEGKVFAVAGASNNREKYGNKVLRAYMQNGYSPLPINPNESEIEGLRAYQNLQSLPEKPHGVSIITPPAVTKSIINQIVELQIRNVWIQPGAEDEEAIESAERAGINVIANGPCLLVAVGFRE